MAAPGTHYAIKRLTRSDLSFFKHHYEAARAENPTSSAQKSINLNSDVFIAKMYPDLVAGTDIPIALSVAGPTGDDYQRLMRKIVRSPNSKNWRLNGEFVPDPEEEIARYHLLREGDLALLAFEGGTQPNSVACLLVSADQNQQAHAALDALLDPRGESMIALDPAQLRDLIAGLPEDVQYPLSLLSETALLEELAQGGGGIRLPGLGPTVSAADMEQRRRQIALRGRRGEQAYAAYLDREIEAGTIEGYEWVSLTRAAAPLDFYVTRGGVQHDVEVKTTALAFATPFHLSVGEARRLVQRGEDYELVRIYGLTDTEALFRSVAGLGEHVKFALSQLDALPEGFGVDSVSVDVSKLDEVVLGDEIVLSLGGGAENE